MIRPATPLTVLLFGAFVLLLISVLSTPVVRGIPLCEVGDVSFGVFGYCRANDCSDIAIGYDIDAPTSDPDSTFDLPSSVRGSLSAILIVHPVAAFITLIMLIMAIAAHFHGPSHSSRYLLVLFILLVVDFLVSLLAFLVDVLLFIPHMAWGSYLVLAATIILLVSCVVTCAMRRAITGRKSRQKQIADNAEMSGENYYNREAQSKAAVVTTAQPSIPSISGANGGGDGLPHFASFESQQKNDLDNDERVPLTQRSPASRSAHTANNETAIAAGGPPFNPPSRSGSQDRYGSPVNGAPMDAYAAGARAPGQGFDRANSRGRGNMGPQAAYRGAPPGRGGFDNYGAPMRGRGGYGGPGRGNFGPRGGRGGYGPPGRGGFGPGPRGGNAYAVAAGPGGMRGGRSPPPGAMNAGSFDRRPTPESQAAYNQSQPSDPALNYGQNNTTNFSLPSANSGGYDAYNPDSAGLPRAESPPPLPGTAMEAPALGMGQAIEMEGIPPKGYGQYGQLRDSDIDVAGMVGLQQGKPPGPAGRHDTYMSEASKYSTDEQSHYVPPRTGWGQGSRGHPSQIPSPLHVQNRPSSARNSPAPPPADGYYEDVDPRFATASSTNTQPSQHNLTPPEPIYEDVRAGNTGARSPAESERSNFTSISQRGINPRWHPPPPMPQAPARKPEPRHQDVLLDMPDFQLPGGAAKGPQRRPNPGMIPGSAYPAGPMG